MNYKISHPTKIIKCDIKLPASKSISNRLLIIKHLCQEDFKIQNLSESDDTKILQSALNSLQNNIDINHAGTSFRFLCSFLALQNNKEFILTGSKRLKERPMQDLIETLKKMGGKIEYLEKEGFAPIKILGTELKGGLIEIDGSISSQFISSILLISPRIKHGIQLKIKGEIVSKPYISMTLRLMSEYGIEWSWDDDVITIMKQDYKAKDYTVESDWSSASFWFEIASLSKECNIRLIGLQNESIQGDRKIVEKFNSLGVSTIFKDKTWILTKNKYNHFPKQDNLLDNPDLYQPLRCTLFAKNIETQFSGLETLKNKETDRINAVNKELAKINMTNLIETHNDHRMAMSFAPLALRFEGLQINNIEVVSKSYPKFWDDLRKAGFIIYS